MSYLCEIDVLHYGDYFQWKVGGDGDNGETLMYEMDSYFEQQEQTAKTNLAAVTRERCESPALTGEASS
jgi:hypothetical protein